MTVLTRDQVDREICSRTAELEVLAATLVELDARESEELARGLLARKPCDLRAVTRAVTDYQQLITRKRGAR